MIDPAEYEMINHAEYEMIDHAEHEMINPAEYEMINHAEYEMIDHAEHEMINHAEYEMINHAEYEMINHASNIPLRASFMEEHPDYKFTRSRKRKVTPHQQQMQQQQNASEDSLRAVHMKEHPDYKYRPRRKTKTLMKKEKAGFGMNTGNTISNQPTPPEPPRSTNSSAVVNSHTRSSSDMYAQMSNGYMPNGYPPGMCMDPQQYGSPYGHMAYSRYDVSSMYASASSPSYLNGSSYAGYGPPPSTSPYLSQGKPGDPGSPYLKEAPPTPPNSATPEGTCPSLDPRGKQDPYPKEYGRDPYSIPPPPQHPPGTDLRQMISMYLPPNAPHNMAPPGVPGYAHHVMVSSGDGPPHHMVPQHLAPLAPPL
ncbi:unnamed protein product [Cyprideis torosa]|uniref:Uncharacterized protein n=1 Tax=Cyprideis torosa TaxID=163714 RepID=A0A7R8ZRJ7_9CRUS|nr:unnamed protein product [Cyprideis torosa]CAG0903949.1 unnamed protein product [Cyprideis torosa]